MNYPPSRQRVLCTLTGLVSTLMCLHVGGHVAAQTAGESGLTDAETAAEVPAELPSNPYDAPVAGDEAPTEVDAPSDLAPALDAEPQPTIPPCDESCAADDAEPAVTLDVRANVDWISAGRWILPSDTRANPGNATFRIAQLGAQTELRPNLRIDYGSLLSAVIQPRMLATADLTAVDGDFGPLEADARISILQLYASLQVNESVSLAYGVQNFQWGPAELLSPSNRLFPIVSFQRDPLFVVPGRNLVRVNLSAGKSVSLVLLAEVLPSDQPTFHARDDFKRQGLAKLEYMRDDGSSYIGITTGAGNHARPWFGEYGSLALTDAWSAYCDVAHTQGSRALRPVRQPDDTTIFRSTLAREDRIRTLSDCGTSFTFEQGTELRAEYIFNDAGYARSELREATRAVTHLPSLAQAAGAYVAPGLQVLARHAAYASIRIVDLPPSRRVALIGRYLWSATDGSGSAFTVITVDATDALVLFSSAIATHGPQYGENSRFVAAGVVAGATYSM